MSLKYTNLNHDFIQLNFGAIVNYGTGDVWLTLMLPLGVGLGRLCVYRIRSIELSLSFESAHAHVFEQSGYGLLLDQ